MLTNHRIQKFAQDLPGWLFCFVWHCGSLTLCRGIQLASGLVERAQEGCTHMVPSTLGWGEGWGAGHSWTLLPCSLRTSRGNLSLRAVRIPTGQLRALRNQGRSCQLSEGPAWSGRGVTDIVHYQSNRRFKTLEKRTHLPMGSVSKSSQTLLLCH